MKLNRKTNKIILQKKDYEQQIIFLDGYIAVNGAYLIKADFVEFESDLMQDRVNRNNYFSILQGSETNFPNAEHWQHLIETTESEPVRIHNIFYQNENSIAKQLLTNLTNNKIILMNADFCKIIKALNGNVTQTINNDLQPVTVHKNGELLGLFMPTCNRTILNEINQFIIDSTESKDEIGAVPNEHQ